MNGKLMAHICILMSAWKLDLSHIMLPGKVTLCLILAIVVSNYTSLTKQNVCIERPYYC